ncbi:MAG: hypothetical protein JWR52_2630 [Marmoricola sp.]|nr:hypothetical protein [Marmoricola sp.]
MFSKKDKPPKFNPSPGLVKLSYRLLLEDKTMVAVLFIGGLTSAFVLAAIIVPAWTIGHITPDLMHGGIRGLLVYAAALWAAAFVTTFTSGVVVAAAHIRCENGEPDIRRALAVAWSRRGPLAAWAALSTLVALVMQLLERTGVAGIILRLFAGITWAVATVFAVPILIAEGTGPLETTRRSAQIVRGKLGTVVRSNIRLAAPWIAAMIITAFVATGGGIAFGVGVSGTNLPAAIIGGIVMTVAGVGFFFCTATSSALSAYLDTLLYRHATGLPVPPIEPQDMPPAPVW